MASLRYETASKRNVQNILDRFHGVNKGNAETRKLYLEKFSKIKEFSLDKLKVFVGVRQSDTSLDAPLGRIVEEMNASLKKAEKAEKKATAVLDSAAEVKESLSDVPLKFVLPKAKKPTVTTKKSKHRPEHEH